MCMSLESSLYLSVLYKCVIYYIIIFAPMSSWEGVQKGVSTEYHNTLLQNFLPPTLPASRHTQSIIAIVGTLAKWLAGQVLELGFESRANHCGTVEKPSSVGSSHGYQRFMQCRYSSASGGFRSLVPSDRAVICCAKPPRSYLLADFIKRYI